MAFKPTTTRALARVQGVKILTYGPAGSGKTRLCATTGELDRTLIISCEAGLLSLRDIDVSVAEVKSLHDIREIYKILLSGDHNFSWVCLDSITDMADVVLAEEKKRTSDGRRAYGELADKMTDIIRAFRSLSLNVYITAQMGTSLDDREQTVCQPRMPGKTLTDRLPYMFDEVFALRVQRDQENRPFTSLQTQADHRYTAKDRSGALAMYEPPNLAQICAKIKGE